MRKMSLLSLGLVLLFAVLFSSQAVSASEVQKYQIQNIVRVFYHDASSYFDGCNFHERPESVEISFLYKDGDKVKFSPKFSFPSDKLEIFCDVPNDGMMSAYIERSSLGWRWSYLRVEIHLKSFDYIEGGTWIKTSYAIFPQTEKGQTNVLR